MAREHNFLLGQGERLALNVRVPQGGSTKNLPYSHETALARLVPAIEGVAAQVAALPDSACYRDEAVAIVTMHPRYLAKSDFPDALLRTAGLRPIGSRTRILTPEAWGVAAHGDQGLGEDIFVAGARAAFARLSHRVGQWAQTSREAKELRQVEAVHFPLPEEKLIAQGLQERSLVEFVLHGAEAPGVLTAFTRYAEANGAEPVLEYSRDAGGLTFLPVRVGPDVALELARFSFVRMARSAPRLRPIRPLLRSVGERRRVQLPEPQEDVELERVVVFDGGIPEDVREALAPWARLIEPDGIGPASADFEEHGLAVTGALLFGSAVLGQPLPHPTCFVDHVRVMDYDASVPGDEGAYLVLSRIERYLREHVGEYSFINLSVGLELPIDDDDVTAWTSTIDALLAAGDTVTAVATGNEGDGDQEAGLHRIQPPADGVNVLSVGAADSDRPGWARAWYSSYGPGRSPGLVKPDGVAFGGDDPSPFLCIGPDLELVYGSGTSLAAPHALRAAAAIRHQLSDQLNPLAIRALLIHRAENDEDHNWHEVGWGKLETDPDRAVTCEDDEAIVVYVGTLPIGEHLRLPVPLPDLPNPCNVAISATMLIATEVDPDHAASYTRSGVEITFRPHSDRYTIRDGRQSEHPKSVPFFNEANLYGRGEGALRADGHKWEPCLNASRTFRSSSLRTPAFDVYYHSRRGGRPVVDPPPIPYAFVLGLRSAAVLDLYDRVVRSYAQVLEPLRPQTRLQLAAG